MRIQLMDIKRQHETYADEYEEAVLRVLRSGKYIGGDEVESFEREFAAYEGAKYGISCGNGTDALVIALRAIGVEPGDEVITTAFTFFATAESVAAVGAKPVFVDVDEKTYCIDPLLVEKAITNNTKAVIAVHIYGQAADMDSLRSICDKYGLVLICDCAQSTGTRLHGERKNTLGDISCFSFFPTKNLGGAGDGGMILTNNAEYADTCYSLRAHGSGEKGYKTLCRLYGNLPSDIAVGHDKYHNYLVGYNSRLDSIQAALLRCKLKHLDEFIEGRRRIAKYYNESFRDSDFVIPFERKDTDHSYYIYALRHKNAKIIMERLREQGIPAQTYYPVPLHLQGVFWELGYKRGDLPITEALCKETFAIPVFPELEDDELKYIVENIRR